MRNIAPIAITVAICGAAAAMAQTGSKTPPPAPVHVMIVGCVEPSDQSTGTAGTSASKDDTKYKLTSAHTTTTSAGSKAGSNKNQGSANRSGGNASNTTYQLSGNEPAVAAEVGHIVEIAAIPEQSPAGGRAPTSSAGTPIMVVEEVRLVSPNCQ